LKAQSASAYQISFKSDYFRLNYSDKTIFKMAAIRHLEFSKFGILVIRPAVLRKRINWYRKRISEIFKNAYRQCTKTHWKSIRKRTKL